MTDATPRRPSFIPSLAYKDNRAALEWLQRAFGFAPSEILTDADGNIVHAEMTHGDGIVMIGTEWADWTRSPASLGGKNTQRVHVRIENGIDEHCARARQASSTASAPISPPTSKAITGPSRNPSGTSRGKRWRRRADSGSSGCRDGAGIRPASSSAPPTASLRRYEPTGQAALGPGSSSSAPIASSIRCVGAVLRRDARETTADPASAVDPVSDDNCRRSRFLRSAASG